MSSLSRTASESVIGDLVKAGWVVDEGPVASRTATPGRPASVFRMAPDLGFLAGVDIGAHHVSACVADLAGDLLATVRLDAEESADAEERLELALTALRDAADQSEVSLADLWTVTIASPGVIDDGTVVHFGGEGMPGWIGLDIAGWFSAVCDAHVLVEGDSALGAVGELAHGAGKGVSDMVYILSGIRTGAAVVVGGELHRGNRGAAGLVGELPELRWRELELESYGRDAYAGARPDRREIFRRARDGDARARAAVNDFSDALGLGLAAMVLAINPEIVVLGGPNARDGDLFIERLRADIEARCPLPPELRLSPIGSDAVLAGCVRMGEEAIRGALRDSVERRPSFPAPDRDEVVWVIRDASR